MNTQTLDSISLQDIEPTKIKPDLGISADGQKEIANELKKVLADSYMLMLKTHNYHWNVRGPQFLSIHKLTEESYTDLFNAVDDIAERIRSLGFLAPGSLSDFSMLSNLPEGDPSLSAMEMIQDLVASHEAVIRTCRAALNTADHHTDHSTVDLLTVRSSVHEKAAWLYRSFLEQ